MQQDKLGIIVYFVDIALPEFNVTGMVCAVGHTILTCDDLTSAKLEAQPCPVSPNPWRNMSVAVCFPLADTTTGLELIVEAEF